MTEQPILEGLEKRCRKCGAVRTPGKRCQPCWSAYAKARHRANRERLLAHGRAWRAANLEKARAASRRWRAANRDKANATTKAWDATNAEGAKARHHASYVANRERVLTRSEARRKANPELSRAYSKKWGAANRDKVAVRSRTTLLRRYGLTPVAFDALLAAQSGACKICFAIKPGGNRSWHVDHDHSCCPGNRSCGRCVRGLLCCSCNLLLGHAGDSAEVLRRAIEYLAAPQCLRLVSGGK